MKKRKCIQGWITTIAEVFAIGAVIYGFIKFYGDKQDITAQLKQTTDLAIATNKLAITSDSTLKEFRRQNELIEIQNNILQENTDNETNRYIEGLMPYFKIRSDSVTNLPDADQIENIGKQATIIKIDISPRCNIVLIPYFEPIAYENGGSFQLTIENPKKVKPKDIVLDFTISMKDIKNNRYAQRIYSNKGGRILIEKPKRVN